MAKMVWDNNNQCYTITAANVGPKYNITISSAENHAFLGNVNINTSFKEYNLKSSRTFNHSADWGYEHKIAHTDFSIGLTISDQITDTASGIVDEGLLVNGGQIYTTSASFSSFTFYFDMSDIKSLMDSGDYIPCICEPNTVVYYINIDDQQADSVKVYKVDKSTSSRSTYTLTRGGQVYYRYAWYGNAWIPCWFYRASYNGSENNMGPTSSYNVYLNNEDHLKLVEIKACVY